MTTNGIVAGFYGVLLASVLAIGAQAQASATRAQKEQALVVAQAAQPIVRELRAQIRAERGQGRAHMQQLVRAAFLRIQPQVRGLIETLSPEQRARIEARAQRHGRSFDAARFERRLAWLLSRPGAAARIQRSLQR